jgi:hypothetical protein
LISGNLEKDEGQCDSPISENLVAGMHQFFRDLSMLFVCLSRFARRIQGASVGFIIIIIIIIIMGKMGLNV